MAWTKKQKLIYLNDKQHTTLWSLLSKMALLILGVFLGIGVAATVRAAPMPDDIDAGQLLLRQSDTQPWAPALHLQSTANLHVTGMVVNAEVTQAFQNTSPLWQEARYVFPLPENAAVSGMEITVGDRRIVGKVKEKQQAAREYQAAKTAGKLAALTEQHRPNLFSQKVANIAPGETVTVTLQYQHAVSYRDGEMQLRLPTTLTPRYMPGVLQLQDDATVNIDTGNPWGWALPTTQVPDAHEISPFMVAGGDEASAITNPIRIEVTVEAGLPLADISSPYHAIVVNKENGIHHIRTRRANEPMDRDFVLRWRPVSEHTPQAAVLLESQPAQSDQNAADYAQILLLPPGAVDANNTAQRLPRDVIFIIDTSGSMRGPSIVQAKQSLLLALSRLSTDDYVNVIEFNSFTRPLYQQSQPVNGHTLQQARDFVAALQAEGGTEMKPALAAALQAQPAAERLKQVVFITDGSVGNESELFALIDNALGSARLFTVGIGPAPNSYFMRKAAEFGRGTFTHIGDQQEVTHKMNTLFRKLESPVMRDIQVQWPEGIEVEFYPDQIPDVYQGEPLLLYAKFNQTLPAGDHTMTFSGRLADKPWQQNLVLHKASDTEQAAVDKGIGKRWARAKIDVLLDEKIQGRDEAAVRADVLPLALHHQLLSPYTSFIAVEEVVRRPASETLAKSPVANQLPKGLDPQAFGPAVVQTVAMPRTATSLTASLYIGLILLLIAAFNVWLKKVEFVVVKEGA